MVNYNSNLKNQKMKKRKKIFLYDPNEINAIFILATIKKIGFEIAPFNGAESLLKWILDDYSIVLIMSNKAFKLSPVLLTYTRIFSYKICGLINPLNIKKTDPDPDIMLVLKKLRKNGGIVNTKDIMVPEAWENNSMASRYGRSLQAAKIFLKNTNAEEELVGVIKEAVNEINKKEQGYQISMYADNYDRCRSTLTESKERVKYKCPVKLGDKKIAYAYLDNISLWLDLEKLKNDLVVLHPFIVILQYKLKSANYTWVGSNNTDVGLIFNIRNKKNPYSITLKGDHKKIINFLKTEAKSLSK
jgi:hypothetical protein